MAGLLDFEPYYDFQNPAVGVTRTGIAEKASRWQLKNELDVLDSVDFKDIKYYSMSGAGWVD